MNQLTVQDCQNLLVLIARSQFSGIDEAEVGVYLKHKLVQIANELQQPPQIVESDFPPEE